MSCLVLQMSELHAVWQLVDMSSKGHYRLLHRCLIHQVNWSKSFVDHLTALFVLSADQYEAYCLHRYLNLSCQYLHHHSHRISFVHLPQEFIQWPYWIGPISLECLTAAHLWWHHQVDRNWGCSKDHLHSSHLVFSCSSQQLHHRVSLHFATGTMAVQWTHQGSEDHLPCIFIFQYCFSDGLNAFIIYHASLFIFTFVFLMFDYLSCFWQVGAWVCQLGLCFGVQVVGWSLRTLSHNHVIPISLRNSSKAPIDGCFLANQDKCRTSGELAAAIPQFSDAGNLRSYQKLSEQLLGTTLYQSPYLTGHESGWQTH